MAKEKVERKEEPEEEQEPKNVGVEQDLLRHIYDTPEERMPEMAIIRTRLIHGLTTMQAWEKEFQEVVKQIRTYQAWFALNRTRKITTKQAEQKEVKTVKVLDAGNLKQRFLWKWFRLKSCKPVMKDEEVTRIIPAVYAYEFDKEKAAELFKDIIDNDKVDSKQLFSYAWRQSLYAHSRSEEGNQLKGARDLEEGIIAVKNQAGEDTLGLPQ